jgi:hypothetical protein
VGEGRNRAIDRHGRLVVSLPSRPDRAGTIGRGPEAADVVEHVVQADPGDVLHGVRADAVLLAEVEDRDDVGVMQPRRRAGLDLEPPQIRFGRRGTTGA